MLPVALAIADEYAQCSDNLLEENGSRMMIEEEENEMSKSRVNAIKKSSTCSLQ